MIAELVEAALRSLLVALAVWAGLQAFRVRNVQAQKAAWALVLVSAIVMPLLLPVTASWQFVPASARVVLPADPQTLLEELQARIQSRISTATPAARRPSPDVFAGPQAESPQSEESATPVRETPSSHRSPASHDASPLRAAPAPSPLLARLPSPIQSPPESAAQVSPLTTAPPFALAPTLWLVYLLVVAALLLRLCYGLVVALRIWHGAVRVSVHADSVLGAGLHLRSSRAVSSPVTIGSAVVLPADFATWDSEKLRIVLAHERSHIRQGDFYVQLLTALYASLFWISPLGWWLKRKLSDLAEAISDRAGLEQAASRSAYAQVLLEFAATPRPTFIGVAMARNGSLSRRIERLLNDTSFRQAFAGNRLRALLAVLLVPTALFAATALIRVEAASQAPQSPAPQAVPSAPAPPPSPADAAEPTEPAEPLTGQAHPDQAPDEAPAPPPAASADQALPAPKAPSMPPLPSADIVAPLPPIGPGPDMVIRVAPIKIDPPVIHLDIPDGDRRSFIIARALQNAGGKASFYHYSSNGDSYAVVTGDERQHLTFSGDIHTNDIDKARKQAHGDFLWFTHDGKSYFVDDPTIVAQVQSTNQPIDEIRKQQEMLGLQQRILGKQQQELGHVKVSTIVAAPDVSKEMAELNEAVAKMQATVGKTLTQEQLARLQAVLGQLQARLGELQGQLGAKRFLFVDQQAKLGAEQGALDAQQGKLGAEQARIAAEMDQKVKSIIDQSLKNGTAHPVQ